MLDIGSQCSHSPCKEIDFLPIYCRCQRYFCRAHSSADAHGCTYIVRPTDLPSVPGSSLQRCAAVGCTKPSLESFVHSDAEGRTPAKCSDCQGSFCAEHRHPQSHSCQTEPTERPKNEAARALLAKNFPTTSKRKVPASRAPTSRNSTDPAKLLMNMRHRAVPLDPRDKQTALPPSDRLHIKLLCDDNKEMIFWVRKSLGTGRVLDLLADRLGISSETAVCWPFTSSLCLTDSSSL
ncbi:hypothetical protein GGX14DRAFT_356387 [Mycena pura]|uniref:AN1-type domain-containing protein n=1 Tax=Mycena pura TaxID=153505 RepID=A0AAD6VP74_9AGAR|nr:hypothetical protein GGX14DRAFT_356387 [Mycena pura]